ncbi:hypothetical protein AURDEDRAFT_171653 [Auricularia subglabra TFB-10046 SS5]|nr:hypothetical protein AURDEDRAFT_171653 [Auricularia subglabra TFB-10046 SS5]
MVDWQSPEVVALSLALSAYSVGIGATITIWEVFLALPFDVEVVARRPLSFAGACYFLARPTVLFVLIPAVRIRTARAEINCAAWAETVYVAGYVTQAFASGLLLLRVLAISRHNQWIRYTLLIYYFCSMPVFVYELSQMRFVWNKTFAACVVSSQRENLVCTVLVALFDFLCLGSLIYLLRRGTRGSTMWEFVHKQGLLWFASMVFAHSCSLTLLALDLNSPLSEMGQGASIVTSTICATRMYSDLLRYATFGDEQNSSSIDEDPALNAAISRLRHRLQGRKARAPAAYPLSVLTNTDISADVQICSCVVG